MKSKQYPLRNSWTCKLRVYMLCSTAAGAWGRGCSEQN